VTVKIIALFFTVSNEDRERDREKKTNKGEEKKDKSLLSDLFFSFFFFEIGSGTHPPSPRTGGAG
jgi:hypothetical protein